MRLSEYMNMILFSLSESFEWIFKAICVSDGC